MRFRSQEAFRDQPGRCWLWILGEHQVPGTMFAWIPLSRPSPERGAGVRGLYVERFMPRRLGQGPGRSERARTSALC